MTTLTTAEINALAAEAAGAAPTRSANKERAIAKLTTAIGGIVGPERAAAATGSILANESEHAAASALRRLKERADTRLPIPAKATPTVDTSGLAQAAAEDEAETAAAAEADRIAEKLIAAKRLHEATGGRAARRASLRLVEKAAPAEKPAKAPKAAKEPGKRAAILEAAQRGELPAAPDFSAETHKRFRGKLAEAVALAEAGDIAGLEAFQINPVSSSPKAIAKYRDLCLIALRARAGKDGAAA